MNMTILYILLFVFLGLFALWLFYHVLAALYWVGWVFLWLGILAVIGFIAYSIVKPKLPTLEQFGIKKTVKYKLADPKHGHVYVFRNEPSLKDVAMLQDEMHVTKLELQGEVIQIDNNTLVTVVDDTNPQSVKIKIKNTKSKEKIFWAARSSVVKAELPKLTG